MSVQLNLFPDNPKPIKVSIPLKQPSREIIVELPHDTKLEEAIGLALIQLGDAAAYLDWTLARVE